MAVARPPLLVGIDTGGTFTDLIALAGNRVVTHKILSTPHDPAAAVLQGLREMLRGDSPAVVTYSSTVATNAILERRGARVALLTTAGFEDVIEIGRQNRPRLFALEPRATEPLVPHERRVGVRERMLFDGTALQPLTESEIERALRRLARLRPDAIAVCLLHAYANSEHERRLGAAIRKQWSLPCSLSHELVPEYREYERTSTVVLNAYVAPTMARHVTDLQQQLAPAHLRVMQSNGGAISAAVAAREPVRTALSGPAGGVIGACHIARQLGIERLITFDMGGTSTDVCLVDGVPELRNEWQIAGLPLKVPALDIHTVGAGGGSLADVDSGGALRVGPRSAGADPGPACYGKGSLPTVTDANLLLGRIVADAFLGGAMQLSVERAEAAFQPLARALRVDAVSAAEGVIEVVNAGMERALRAISIERGYDPRALALIAFGGAAGQHACELATALGIRRVIVPRHPGLLSAWGCAIADVERDYSSAVFTAGTNRKPLRDALATLTRRAHAELTAEGTPRARQRIQRRVDLRYAGQSHELSIPFGPRLIADFHDQHEKLYGYRDVGRAVEAITVRVHAVGLSTADPTAAPSLARRPGRTPASRRVRGRGRWLPTHILWREQLGRAAVRGPALLLELSATTFVPPGWQARVATNGHLVLSHGR